MFLRPLTVLCSSSYGSNSDDMSVVFQAECVFFSPGWSKPQVSSIHNGSLGCLKLQI